MKPKQAYEILIVDRPLQARDVAEHVQKIQSDTTIGAYDIFLGQVRADTLDGKTVSEIDYSCFREMALAQLEQICKETLEKFGTTRITIMHSMGSVKKGELCLFVLAGDGHRKNIFNSCSFIVEQIKKHVPIWGKEVFKDHSHTWKINTF